MMSEDSDDSDDYIPSLKKRSGRNYIPKQKVTSPDSHKIADRYYTSVRQQAAIVNSSLSTIGEDRSVTSSALYHARIKAR